MGHPDLPKRPAGEPESRAGGAGQPPTPGPPPAPPEPTEDFHDAMQDTQHIVLHAQRDDQRAWVLLSGKVTFFLRSRFGHVALPGGFEFDDFGSEVMLKLLGEIRRFQDQGKGSFWGWVYMVAQNRLNDLWRKHNRDRQLGLVGRGDPDEETSSTQTIRMDQHRDDDASSISEVLDFQVLEAAERDCVQRLPKDMREVYLLRRQHELPFAEISTRTGGIKEVTLRSHFKRARDYVKDCIKRKIDDLGSRFEDWRE